MAALVCTAMDLQQQAVQSKNVFRNILRASNFLWVVGMYSFPSPFHPIGVLSSITVVQTWLTVILHSMLMNAYWTMNRFPDEDSLTSWYALAFLNVIVKRVSGKTVVVCGTLVCPHLSSWRFLVIEPLNRWCNWYWRWETWLWDCQEIHVYFQIFTTRISLFNEYKISGLVLNKTLLLVSRETAFEEYATDICMPAVFNIN